jgi:hypothetical protein
MENKIKVKKVEVKSEIPKDWDILREWAINQTDYEVSYHSMEPEIDIWLKDDNCCHIKLTRDGRWEIQ